MFSTDGDILSVLILGWMLGSRNTFTSVAVPHFLRLDNALWNSRLFLRCAEDRGKIVCVSETSSKYIDVSAWSVPMTSLYFVAFDEPLNRVHM